MMKLRTDNAVREALADMLGMLEYKVRNGAMSKDDTRAFWIFQRESPEEELCL